MIVWQKDGVPVGVHSATLTVLSSLGEVADGERAERLDKLSEEGSVAGVWPTWCEFRRRRGERIQADRMRQLSCGVVQPAGRLEKSLSLARCCRAGVEYGGESRYAVIVAEVALGCRLRGRASSPSGRPS